MAKAARNYEDLWNIQNKRKQTVGKLTFRPALYAAPLIVFKENAKMSNF